MPSTQPSSGSPYMTPSSAPSSPDHVEDPYLSFPAPHGAPATSVCRYAGKKCLNLRALKRNGSLHNLCHYHRVRANQNQRRMELRRRIKRVHEEKAMDMAHHPAYYAVVPGANAGAGVGSFSAMMRSEELSAADWGYFGGLPPDSGMFPPPPQQDRLSELFSAPSHYVVDLPYTTYAPHKHDLASYHQHQYPVAFSTPVDHHLMAAKGRILGFCSSVDHHQQQQQIAWCDQGLLLPL